MAITIENFTQIEKFDDKESIIFLQNLLITLGYSPWKVDGVLWKKTVAALVQFQKDFNKKFPITPEEQLIEEGEITPSTLLALKIMYHATIEYDVMRDLDILETTMSLQEMNDKIQN